MSGFLYFLPGVSGLREDTLERFGLGYLEPRGWAFRGVRGGIGEGIIIGRDPGEIGYFPDRQEWRERLAGSGSKLGWEIGEKPGPEQLARAQQIPGYLIELGDGSRWLVPTARYFPDGTALPQRLILGPDGELTEELLPRYVEFSKQVEEAYEEFKRVAEGGAIPDDRRRWYYDLAIEALGLNYEISVDECNVLGLVTTGNLYTIVGALFDFLNMIAEYQKKTAGSCEDGPEEAEAETTGRPSASSGNGAADED